MGCLLPELYRKQNNKSTEHESCSLFRRCSGFRSCGISALLCGFHRFGKCIPYYTNTTLPFVGPILISTIQLGATVDYAILMTTRYKQGRCSGKDKKTAVGEAVASSAQSILVSGIGFFAATFGVGLYSNVDIISSMCRLISRGALCSVVVVLFLLPALLLAADGLIVHTTLNMKNKTERTQSV